MYILSLETSTKVFSLCVSQGDKVLRYRNVKNADALENTIITTIDALLASASLSFKKLDAFAIALGPGSFTSLRVGLSTVKAFCMATQKPLVGISSLDIIAKGLGKVKADQICVINDARRGNVYAALYSAKAERQGEYMLTTLEALLKQVSGKTIFVGDAVALYKKDIEAAYKAHANPSCKAYFATEKFCLPKAQVLAGLAYQRLKNNDIDRADAVVPIYLYPQDCQVDKRGR